MRLCGVWSVVPLLLAPDDVVQAAVPETGLTNSAVLVQAFGGFFGAFFAFIFVELGRRLERRRERWRKNHNNLVRLQHQGNRLLVSLQENQHAIASTKGFVSEHINDAIVPLPLNRCNAVRFDEEIHDGLRNIDFVNDVVRFHENLRSFNSTIETIDQSYVLMRDALVSQQTSGMVYRMHLATYADRLAEVEPFVDALIAETKTIIARSRILIRRNRRSRPGFFGQKLEKYDDVMTKEMSVALAKLDGELEAVKSESKARIDRIQAGR